MKNILASKAKIKIAHNLQELEDQIILTLKDRPLLSKNNELLEDEDEEILQNQQLQEDKAAAHNAELRNKIKILSDVNSSHLEAKNQGLSGILPHYDDHAYHPEMIQLEDGGKVIKKNFKRNHKNQIASDYQEKTNVSKLNAEYESSTHLFAKKNFNQKKSSESLLQFLDETAEDNVNTSSLKRQFLAEDIIEQSIDNIKKKRILNHSNNSQIISLIPNKNYAEEEDIMLMKAIERSRKRQTKKDHFNQLLQNIKEQEQGEDEKDKGSTEKFVEIQLNPVAYKSTDHYRKTNEDNVEIKDVRKGTSSAMFLSLPSERLAKKIQQQKIVQALPDSFKDISKEELQKMKEEISFLEQKQVGIGLAGTLKFLRQNQLLGKEEQVGRSKDETLSYNDPEDRIKLEYRNSSGKLMKPKQAFRYMCATFHGEGPGKNKVEKRKKKELEELRMKEQTNQGGKLMNLLQQHQEKNGSAHMVLEFGGGKKSK